MWSNKVSTLSLGLIEYGNDWGPQFLLITLDCKIYGTTIKMFIPNFLNKLWQPP